MKVIERSLQEIGQSLLVTLPKSWTKSLNLEKGSNIKMTISEAGNLLIAPEFVKKEEKKEMTLKYDSFFAKRFFSAYFDGCEKITITFEREEKIHTFLDKFMNVQIIEETSNKIVLKVFKIEELSIEECLKRMFYLSLNMFDEVSNNNRLNELKHSLIKFYYMLVLQMRRFLSEGKYTEENQISLLRATDCRMVAEKIEKMSDILLEIKKDKSINEIKQFYSKSFNSFFNNEFEKSLGLLKEKKELDKKIKESNLLSFAHDIGMLTKQ